MKSPIENSIKILDVDINDISDFVGLASASDQQEARETVLDIGALLQRYGSPTIMKTWEILARLALIDQCHEQEIRMEASRQLGIPPNTLRQNIFRIRNIIDSPFPIQPEHQHHNRDTKDSAPQRAQAKNTLAELLSLFKQLRRSILTNPDRCQLRFEFDTSISRFVRLKWLVENCPESELPKYLREYDVYRVMLDDWTWGFI